MKKFRVQFTEKVAYVTEIEAESKEEAALLAKHYVEEDTFPMDEPERQEGVISVWEAGGDGKPYEVELDD